MPDSRQPPIAPATSTPEADEQVALAAGDIAACDSAGDEAAAALLDGLAGTVLTLGDEAYPHGTAEQFADCYDPSWGRHKARTRPVPGNHEYDTDPAAAAYFAYFGAAAGDPATGYYSYDLGAWHVVALNSNCADVGGCEVGAPQERWLRADLALHPARCTLALWHDRRFSSDGNGTQTQAFWRALYESGAELVLSGHVHVYERVAPLNGDGEVDPERGIRQFIVGTGGAGLGEFRNPLPTSEVRDNQAYGVSRLTLGTTGYRWEFLPEAGKTFTDSGSAPCH